MKIVYFAPIPYGNMKQRPQYLAEQLAKEHEVLYVDPTVSIMKYLLKGGEKPFSYQYSAGENLTILRMNGMLSAHRSLQAFSRHLCFWEKFQLKRYLRDANLVWVGYSPWFDLVRKFDGVVVYDKMDDDLQITKNSVLRKLIMRTEPELTQRADLIFVTAQIFAEQMKEQGKYPVLLPNAVDRQQAISISSEKKQISERRVFGYVGMIAHWFDMDAIQTILDADERNHVVLVGPEEIPRLQHERLQYVGYVPKEEVGEWIRRFDVCLYPFLKTDFLDTIDPVKIYEYIAENKPVLAAHSREIEKFGNLVVNYKSKEDLQIILKSKKLSAPFPDEAVRREFIRQNDWNARGHLVLEQIRQLEQDAMEERGVNS